MQIRQTVLITLLVLLSSWALAQETSSTLDSLLGLLGINLAALGASVLVFGRSIQHAVEWIKGLWKTMPHVLHYILPFAFGLAGSYLIFSVAGISDPDFAEGAGAITWITYGIVGGMIAGGWYRKDKADRVAKAVTVEGSDLPPSRREVL